MKILFLYCQLGKLFFLCSENFHSQGKIICFLKAQITSLQSLTVYFSLHLPNGTKLKIIYKTCSKEKHRVHTFGKQKFMNGGLWF